MPSQNSQPAQPSLSSLTSRFLAARAADPAFPGEPCPVVEPYEAPSGFRTDVRTTWGEALFPVRVGAGVDAVLPVPAGWSAVTREQPLRFAIAFCVGNYPQMLGDAGKLVAADDLPRLARAEVAGSADLKLSDRARRTHTELSTLVQVAEARLKGAFAEATTILTESTPTGGVWENAWANERATLLWEQGLTEQAVAAWEQLSEGPAKWFNLGMAYLFTGHQERADSLLVRAAESLPESSGWAHLARIYSTLCSAA